jgi:hypothetical protein
MKLSRNSFVVTMSLALGALSFSTVASDAIAQPARAGYKWEFHRGANIKFEVPSAWRTTVTGDLLFTKPEKGDLLVEFIAVDSASDAKSAEAALTKAILNRVPTAKTTGPAKPVAQNGLTGVLVQGVGTKNNKPMEWFAVVLSSGKNKGILSAAMGEKGMIDLHRDKIIEIFNSIRPIN